MSKTQILMTKHTPVSRESETNGRFSTNSSGLSNAVFANPGHDLDRTRRAALNPYFPKAKVRSLPARIEEVLDMLMGRFEEF